MIELFLNFKDENGEQRRVPVTGEEFIIGRHSENDLSIVNGRLSRRHIKIQRFADVFIVSDLNSSNGTKLNGEDLEDPVAINNGDVLNLGGGPDLEIELISDEPQSADVSPAKSETEETNAAATGADGSVATVASQPAGGAGLGKALIIAPILGLLLITFAIGGLFLIGGKAEPEISRNGRDDDIDRLSDPKDREDTVIKDSASNDDDETVVGTSNDPDQIDETTPAPPPEESITPTDQVSGNPAGEPEESDDIGRIRNNSFRFMRKIATGKQKPVLLNKQLLVLEKKISQFKNSAALAGNIENARSSASEIQALAGSKRLQPQFLAVAALAKLDNNRGNVLATAQVMAGVLNDLRIQIGNEQADENLIMIAAYDQGVRGDFLAMRNKLQRLGDKDPSRTSEIRSVWFLREKGEITEAQFDFALRVLAIGTITQNPKMFNVNAEALILN